MTQPRARLAAALTLAFAAAAQALNGELLRELEASFVALHEKLGPAVVNIETRGSVDQEDFENFFRFFNVPAPKPELEDMPRSTATGSGFIYDKSGLIVTNNHVIENADAITVRLNNGEEYEAEIVGTDPDTDLAVLRVNAGKELPAATLGDSDKLKVGQFAIAIGSPRQLEGSVSFGHISALNRDGLPGLTSAGLRFQHLIQTDAAINLGNSGGPLCNIDGEVIGINVAIIWGANSIGFAIPINVAREIVPRLIQDGRITRGFLGVGIDDAARYADAVGSPDKKGAFVKEVRPGTPAERAEIQTYDLIRKINGKDVENASDLVHQISSYPPGTTVTIELWRDGAPLSVQVELSEWKGQKTARATEREPLILGMRVNNASPEILERLGLDPATTGVIVTEVKPNSPAEQAGLMHGDLILEVAQQPVNNAKEFADRIKEKSEPGRSLLIRYSRQGGEPDITVIRVPAK